MFGKFAGVEQAGNGIGVTTTARIKAREFYASQNNLIWSTARNDKVNDLLASDFMSADPQTRFKLKSGEVAEIRKSGTFYYVAAIRRNTYDILIIQTTMKQVSPEVSKRRLESPTWGGK